MSIKYDFNCLKDLDPPYVFKSYLNVENTTSTRYCVIAENYFIIFKSQNDIVSCHRVPLNKDTNLEISERHFTITRAKISFKFSDESVERVAQWIEFLKAAVIEDVKEMTGDVEREVVRIDKIGVSECPIVFCKKYCRLLIYESPDYQSSDICSHIIDLKYYSLESIEFQAMSKMLKIKNENGELKFTFKTSHLANQWCSFFKDSINDYMRQLTGIYQNKSNRSCVDCGKPNPKWVSSNMCVTVCETCVRSHRKLGTIISRIETAVINDRFSNDDLLTKLIVEIGNDNANQFWTKNKGRGMSIDKMALFEKKYVKKDFIDTTFASLSPLKMVEKLFDSVRSKDVTLTMRLWFSQKVYFDRVVVNQLLKAAIDSKQDLQEKFLTLQENIDEQTITNEVFLKPIYKGDLLLTVNKKSRNDKHFSVFLYDDRMSIQLTNQKTVHIINIDYINFVIWNKSEKTLQISLIKQCVIFKKNSPFKGPEFIHDLFLKETSNPSLLEFKTSLFGCLLSKNLEPPTNETSLFFISDVEINSQKLSNCKCCLTNHELILTYSEFRKYDLKRTLELKMENDSLSILLKISNDVIYLRSQERSQTFFHCLNEASKFPLLLVNDTLTIQKLKSLIDFIKDEGLMAEGLFRQCGSAKLVESLIDKLLEAREAFTIDSKQYRINDVTSCLKICLQRHLDEDLIPDYAFVAMTTSAKSNDTDSVLLGYKAAVDRLLDTNYEILRLILELLYTIIQMSEFNKMDSTNLSISTAQSILSGKENNLADNNSTLKYLIENFVFLFAYSEEEQISLLGRIETYKRSIK